MRVMVESNVVAMWPQFGMVNFNYSSLYNKYESDIKPEWGRGIAGSVCYHSTRFIVSNSRSTAGCHMDHVMSSFTAISAGSNE